MRVIKSSVSKIKNNPLMAVAGAVGTYMYMTKKMPNSVMTTNKYYLVGIVLLGAVFSAYTSSYIKSKVSKPTSK